MYFARLKNEHGTRLFEILDYKNGKYYVYIDFVFPMNLTRIVYRQTLKVGIKQ
jgi:hypothetical protein|tara:strand:+ start:409 stop:567 length:159 start_codon:yes stop_codon:yes gene_type:complete